MIEIKDLIESERKVSEIKKCISDMNIGLNYSQEQQLHNISLLFMEYANWMYNMGKDGR